MLADRLRLDVHRSVSYIKCRLHCLYRGPLVAVDAEGPGGTRACGSSIEELLPFIREQSHIYEHTHARSGTGALCGGGVLLVMRMHNSESRTLDRVLHMDRPKAANRALSEEPGGAALRVACGVFGYRVGTGYVASYSWDRFVRSFIR